MSNTRKDQVVGEESVDDPGATARQPNVPSRVKAGAVDRRSSAGVVVAVTAPGRSLDERTATPPAGAPLGGYGPQAQAVYQRYAGGPAEEYHHSGNEARVGPGETASSDPSWWDRGVHAAG